MLYVDLETLRITILTNALIKTLKKLYFSLNKTRHQNAISFYTRVLTAPPRKLPTIICTGGFYGAKHSGPNVRYHYGNYEGSVNVFACTNILTEYRFSMEDKRLLNRTLSGEKRKESPKRSRLKIRKVLPKSPRWKTALKTSSEKELIRENQYFLAR